MLRNAGVMRGHKLGTADGEIGRVTDQYFDDETWTVRYFVIDIGSRFQDKRVLISPRRITQVDQDQEMVKAVLTRAEVENSPAAETDRPLAECRDVVAWEVASHGDYLRPLRIDIQGCDNPDVHLLSVKEVEGYGVEATDGDIGHVDSLIVDDSDWAVRYLLVDTRDLWPGKHVLMSPEWVREFAWNVGKLRIDLPRAAIKDAPQVDPDAPISREYEVDLCRFYGREGYWDRPCEGDEPATD